MSSSGLGGGPDVRVDGLTKGVPADAHFSADQIAAQGWNVLRGDTATPVLLVRDEAVDHNIAVMAQFCHTAGVELAPHGKTTLSGSLINRQLAAGAWGVTAATVRQAAVLVSLGVRRVLIANEVVDPHGLRWLASRLNDDPGLDISWCVDSDRGVELAAAAMSGGGRAARLLVELGHPDGRTGCRDDDQALRLAGSVASARGLELAGVSGYEGTIGTARDDATVQAVRTFVRRIGGVYEQCRSDGLIGEQGIVSAGGSIYFDVVASVLGPLSSRQVATVVLRSGCYVTHDHGLYRAATPAGLPDWRLPPFEPALEVWTRVLSRPEPGLALLDAGRRDVSFDAGLPVPLRAVAATGGAVSLGASEVVGLSDQHAFLAVPSSTDLGPGDLVGLGISHPCTTFDRWPQLLVVNDAYDVIGLDRTAF